MRAKTFHVLIRIWGVFGRGPAGTNAGAQGTDQPPDIKQTLYTEVRAPKATWAVRQRYLITKNKLHQARKEKLEALPGWKGAGLLKGAQQQQMNKWETHYRDLCNWLRDERNDKRDPMPRDWWGRSVHERVLAQWLERQLRFLRAALQKQRLQESCAQPVRLDTSAQTSTAKTVQVQGKLAKETAMSPVKIAKLMEYLRTHDLKRYLRTHDLERLASQPSAISIASLSGGDAHPAVAPDVGTQHGAAVVMKRPAASSKNEKDAQPRKRLCLEVQAPTSPSIAAARSSGSSIAQCSAEGGVNKAVAIESSSSGVAQSVAAKQLPSHAGRVLNTGSSDVAQLTATCQEPRSTMVFVRILEPIWEIEVADGKMMFDCVANKTKWQNQFKQLASGDLIIIVMKGRHKVSAVCEVASAATVKETNRDVLKSKLQESRHEALDAYLDGAE